MSCILTPLLIAAIQDRLDAFNLLLELDAKPMLCEAIRYIIERETMYRSIHRHLSKRIKDTYLLTLIGLTCDVEDLTMALADAIHKPCIGDQIILSIIEAGADIDVDIMCDATSVGRISIIQYLLSHGIQPDIRVLNNLVDIADVDMIVQVVGYGVKPTDTTMQILDCRFDKRTRAYKQIRQLLIEAMKN